jgi:hypothetical protein
MKQLIGFLAASIVLIVLLRWYRQETTTEGDGTVRLQSEHEHFHMHVDLPPGMQIQPGDTLEVLSLPKIEGQTVGEIVYPSRIRLSKASWLRRNLIKRSSLLEVGELVEHP